MTRHLPGYPGPWTDSDSGGAAELQTDVMRFMAILALCLVAIFALVQSIPPDAAPTTPAEAPVAAMPVPVSEAATVEPASPPTAIPEPAPVERPMRVEHQPAERQPVEPVPEDPPPVQGSPVVPSPTETLAAAPASVSEPRDAGFTLRFESDEALEALVARNEVGLYAMQGEQARRLQVERGRLEFWRASMPSRFHEMDAATVPADVVRAQARNANGNSGLRWGVTLPPRLSQEIDRRLAGNGSGDLVITANGTLQQE